MKTTYGDLVKMAKEGRFDVIIHGCNCFCTMGGGIAKAIKKAWPSAYFADLKTSRGNQGKLGRYSSTKVGRLTIVNAYTQMYYGRGERFVDYEALRKVFRSIKKAFSGKRIGFPYIGAGLAGGNWKIISKIIDEELEGEDHTLVIYKKG
jgi:O-acetyl-ADP-ribose deacetylase (regulator of RNase III)